MCKRRLLALLIWALLIVSCSHVKSGKYVQINSEKDLEVLADQYQVPLWQIQQANPGVEFSAGKWVFIPMSIGILGAQLQQETVAGNFPLAGNGNDFLWPVPSTSRVSSGFGRRHGRPHHGIDIPAPRGTPVIATADGVVAYAGSELKGYGKIIVLSHANGMFSVYAHNQVNLAREGQTVRKGEQIAQLGNSGRSTGPHLHFEIRYYNRPIDPLVVVRKPDSRPDHHGGRLAMRE